MSKKYKRQVRKEAAKADGSTPASAGQTPASVARASSATSYRMQSNNPTAFNPDYSYVTKDLRRIGLLAGTFISILVIMSFFLR